MESLDEDFCLSENGNATCNRSPREADPLTELYLRHKHLYVRRAKRFIAQLSIDESELDGESAFDLAFFELWRSQVRLEIDQILDNELPKLLSVILRRIIVDAYKRSRAAKRGGKLRLPSANPQNADDKRSDRSACSSPRRVPVDLDHLICHALPVADAVIERIEFDALLEMLPDDVHREILKRHLDGSTVKEIAAILGVARDTVERKRKNIQRIYENSKAELPGIR